MSAAPIVPVTRALVSVSNKAGLTQLGEFLAARRIEILSTGGTAKTLREAGIPVKEVSEHTGFPEIMGGRVKTLHPVIQGGILARRDDPGHRAAMETHGIAPIDLIVINLYPFEETVVAGASFESCIEQIDIGGPTLIRAAAKNHEFAAVVTDPSDYPALMTDMEANDGAVSPVLRRSLAARAYARTAAYDAAISGWMARQFDDKFPQWLVVAGERRLALRYGENPHQEAAFYSAPGPPTGIGAAKQVQGKELSFNNLNDADAACELVAEFGAPAVAIIKHANPCGVAIADGLAEAYHQARRCDPISAFGAVIAANRPIDRVTAEAITELFAEVVIAPSFEVPAMEVLATKKNLRLLTVPTVPDSAQAGYAIRSLSGGYLVQTRDSGHLSETDLKTVTQRRPSGDEIRDMLFAFAVCKHVKSNAIVYAKGGASVGIGAGQMSRVDAARIAVLKARDAATAAGQSVLPTIGAVVASDAFFPFADGLIAAAEAGITAVIQPGGSVRDDEVIAAADERKLAMVFTGIRHFRH